MKQNDKKIFWIVCFASVALGLYRSVMLVAQQPRPLFIAILVINIVALVTNIACLAFDIQKRKGEK